jgi:subtilisin family serine protease
MKKFIYIVFALIASLAFVSCGSNNATSMSGGVVKASSVSQPVLTKITSQAVLTEAVKGNYKEGELLVRFKDGTSATTMANLHQSVGATVIKGFTNVTNLRLVSLPPGLSVVDAIGTYMADANVLYAEPNYLYSTFTAPNDPYFYPQQWALSNTGTYAGGSAGADIHAAGAWDFTVGSRSVAVAVLDTGIDYTHQDLVGNMWVDRVKVFLQDMHWLGHDTFKIVGEKVIVTDPYNIQMPDVADIILISNAHPDHCSPLGVYKMTGPSTVVVTTADCSNILKHDATHPFIGQIMTVHAGSSLTVGGIDITAVPAYNYNTSKTANPKSNGWVGYVFTVNRNRDISPSTDTSKPVVDLNREPGPRIYFAGDTDLIPEMSSAPIKGVDVALLPVSGTTVMNVDEAAQAALTIRPKVAIPMHYGTVEGSADDAQNLADLLEGRVEVSVMADNSSSYTEQTVAYDNNQKIDDWRGWNFIANNNDPWDDVGHGTHVAGIIGATGNNGVGIAGVNWSVDLMPLKVCAADGCPDDAIIDAIGYAAFKGIRIINASLGGPGLSYALRDAIVDAGQAGTILVAAAGNGNADKPGDGVGDNNDVNPVYPASFALDNVISVAATDQNDRRTSFSNFGLQTVHVAAPGQYILSTVPTAVTSVFLGEWCTGVPFAGYNVCSGTSMAAPHVAGLAALLYSLYPDFSYSQIRGMIIKYVDKLTTLDGWIYSGGRINAQWAVTSLLKPSGFVATATSTSQITLSWNDNTGEDSYVIEKKQPGGTFLQIGTVGQNVTTFTDSGLSAGTSYTYRIKAVSSLPNPPNRYAVTAESLYSDEATGTTPSQGGVVTSGGGGGGCSVGGNVNGPGAFADMMVMFAPLFIVIAARTLRRRKR